MLIAAMLALTPGLALSQSADGTADGSDTVSPPPAVTTPPSAATAASPTRSFLSTFGGLFSGDGGSAHTGDLGGGDDGDDYGGTPRRAPRPPEDGDLTPPPTPEVLDGDLSAPPPPEIFADGSRTVPAAGSGVAATTGTARGAAGSARPGAPPGAGSPAGTATPGLATVRRAAPPEESDPYAALGVRMGSFLLFPQIEADIVYSDNVFLTATNPKSDFALELRPSLTARSNWSRHQLEAGISGTLSYYNEFSSEDDREFAARLAGRFDIWRDTNLAGLFSYSLAQESRSSIDLDANTVTPPDVATTTAGLTFNHRWNRAYMRLGAVRTDVDYLSGADASHDDQDHVERELSLRLGYEYSPAVSLFLHGVVNDDTFDIGPGVDGLLRSSSGFEVRAGAALNLRGTIDGEASLGYLRQSADDERLGHIDGWVVDANLNWRPSALTTFTATAGTSFDSATLDHSLGSLAYTFGLAVRHEFRRYFIATAGLAYTLTDYQRATLEERELVASLGAEYILTREAAILAQYQLTSLESNGIDRGYDENEIRLGVRLRR